MKANEPTLDMNPFLMPYETPYGAIPYDRITLEHYIPAVKEAIAREEAAINNICNNSDSPTFGNTIAALDYAGLLLGDIIGAFNAVANACSNDEILAIEEEMQQLYVEHKNNITLNDKLFARIKVVYESDNSHLTTEQQRLLQQTYDSFVRNGANLAEEERDEYRRLTERLATLGVKFQENSIKDTDAYTLHITDEADLEGLPEDVIDAALNNAKENGKEGWIFTLHRPSDLPFMTFCRNRELRKQMYMAYDTIGAKGNGHDNCDTVKETVNCRLKLARLLGYNTYSDYVLSERMAQNTDAVFAMLGKLTWSYLPTARKEMEEVTAFAKKCEGERFDFQPWDFAFYSEKLKEQKFDLTDEMVYNIRDGG